MKKGHNYIIVLLIAILFSQSARGQSFVETKVDSTISDSSFFINTTTRLFNADKRAIDWIWTRKCFYNTGSIKEEYSLVKGYKLHGIYRPYYENGQLKELYNSIYGRKVGLYVEYYSTGITKSVGYYKDISSMSEITEKCDTTDLPDSDHEMKGFLVTCTTESVKTGGWLHFNEVGEIIRKEQY